ncbi:hypothetical protein N7492_005262 [Penicillium capsulatum]|uniref:RING-type domain-containing protein n=1 Tax=Penicillium capsulatum TaxID=69766 RepID=A0A9W9IBB1_9EURO|nr:hypothetical protein N7492_005262 [Penicillium capsulatum]KAJ6135632.1 hypothetical protein N7512_000792 [Penicillium capsulatum]
MGQSSSTARNSSNNGFTDRPLSNHIERSIGTRNEDMNNRETFEPDREAGTSSTPDSYSHGSRDTSLGQLHGQTEDWQQPTRLSGGFPQQMRSIEEENGPELPPMDHELRSAAIARMAARRNSAVSRLGSRILPDSVMRGLLNSQEETPAEGHALRHGLVSRPPPRSESAHSSGRFSPFSALGSRGITRRRPSRGPYFIPSRQDSSVQTDVTGGPSFLENGVERLADPGRASWRRSARLSRMRHSLSTPISHMFGQSSPIMPSHEGSHLAAGPSANGSLPGAMDTRLDFREGMAELDGTERNLEQGGPHQGGQFPSNLPNPNLMSRLPSLLRARSTRAVQREEQTPLSRVLQLAAAAIAAQLSGGAGPALPNIQALGNEGIDGSLENFIQSLQTATNPQASPPPGEGSNGSDNEGPSAPVNFLRVFRFANSESPLGPGPFGAGMSPAENQGTTSNGMPTEDPAEGGEGRTVTLVVVGVRSVPAGNGASGEQRSPGLGAPGLDALLGLPFLPPHGIPRPQDAAGDHAHGADERPRFNVPRPPFQTTGLPDILPEHGQPGGNRRMSDAGPSTTAHSPFPSTLFGSPAESTSRPSAPADQGMSAVSSGTPTPNRRPSSASAMPSGLLPRLHEDRSYQPAVEPTEDSLPPPNAARQRRRSDSEFARHRALGSGSVRRNGVVAPDQPPPSGGRSWLIYVVGTNLAENHPALTTPSLFTDNPTYEDMILLSSLLGPVKPPVATQADIDTAGGLFRLVEYSGSLVAESINGTGAIQIQDGERCLICLSDYEVAEEVRELEKCKHVFHRDCIDQWLTTGRNSCPLCRGQGVHETSNDEGAARGPAAPGPDTMAV